jgi:hypothetical protein
MNGWSALDLILRTDPRDSGCARTMAVLDRYAELAVRDSVAAARRCPEIAAHLHGCAACAADLAGLIAALRRPAD